ncbi:tyrosine-type recombinase/integrase [Vibrio sp. THAF190c]|uniref:tyrosine-type recombinase/integrase n=1 Tax=Vibrio sp. THAF190c TaxID=2587865 RepID=UPI00126838C3|nr:tyrosine-type recombinase/integrase [Vibrio sp. THAF190c]QFT13320.1 site-specific tyrosine recombinase XerC [Vibrio sp. THAF190c]
MKLMAAKRINNKTVSFSPDSEEHTNIVLHVVARYNPLISSFLNVQRLTGLRYSDCSRITVENIAKSSTQIRSQFTIVQKKIYTGALTRLKKNEKYVNHSETELHSIAINKASLRVFISDRLKDVFVEVLKLQDDNPFFNKKDKEALIFTSTHHHAKGNAISKEAINQLLKSDKVGQELLKHGISNENLGSHSFRKEFGQRLLEKGANVIDIQELLGQSSLDSTIKYLSTSDKKKKDLVNSIASQPTIVNSALEGNTSSASGLNNNEDIPTATTENDKLLALIEKAIESGAPESVINGLLSKMK